MTDEKAAEVKSRLAAVKEQLDKIAEDEHLGKAFSEEFRLFNELCRLAERNVDMFDYDEWVEMLSLLEATLKWASPIIALPGESIVDRVRSERQKGN